MRPRTLLAALGGLLFLVPATPATAAPGVEATTYGVLAPDENGVASLALQCRGDTIGHTGAATVSIEVVCDVWDSSGQPGIRQRRIQAGPTCDCTIVAQGLVMPIRYCSTATATFSNGSTLTDQACKSYGVPVPPENVPPPGDPRLLECADPAGTGL